MRPTLLSVCCLLAGLLCVPAASHGQDRRGRSTPGIVLDTGARMGNCDVLTFSPDGQELLAVGDDKVVRVWRVGKDTIDGGSSRAFRWPIYREQVGSIYAMALSPDGGRIAIGGHGLRIGLVAVLDRVTGKIVRVMRKRKPDSDAVTTFLTWSPNGKYVLQGTSKGEVYLWNPTAKDSEGQKFQGDNPQERNWVRLITFLPRPHDNQFLVVTGHGKILRRTLDPTTPGEELLAVPDEIRYAAASPDKSKLALARMNRTEVSGGNRDVDLLDVASLVNGRRAGAQALIRMPTRPNFVRRPTRLAFSDDGSRLAVGMQEIREKKNPGVEEFGRSSGGVIHVWGLGGAAPNLLTTSGFATGYDVDGLAFRPGRRQLAASGGTNHEIRLFDLDNDAAPALSEIRSPGSCLWAVRMSDDGKYLAWRDRLNPDPQHPNDRAAGEWRFFTLGAPADGRPRRILPQPPAKYTLVEPLTTAGGWRVVPINGFTWSVKHEPTGFSRALSQKTLLYNDSVNQVPQCYTFVRTEGKPTRLAVGHMWGTSVYELDEKEPDDAKKVQLARVLLGHQGSVMSVAPSKRGDLLVSAGRDQTICCWSLKDWPSNPELGARFVEQAGEVRVAAVDPGSPAWEAGLTVGEKVDFVGIIEPTSIKAHVYDPHGNLEPRSSGGRLADGRHVFDGEEGTWTFDVRNTCKPAEIIRLLHEAKTGRNHYFGRLDEGKKMHGQQTSLRQRPLWVFFPTRAEKGNNWLAWRWRDYVYDSNLQQTDQFAGLQRTAGDAETPRFHRLGNVAGTIGKRSSELEQQYYNPAKLWKYVENVFAKDPDTTRILFADVEPPRVEIQVTQWPFDPKNPKAVQDLKIAVTVTPYSAGGAAARQQVRRVSLWLDDFLVDAGDRMSAPDPKTGTVTMARTIPHGQLRRGVNRVRAVGFNAAGGVAEKVVQVQFDDPARGKRQLLGLCVGVSDYKNVRRRSPGYGLVDLRCPKNDARALWEVFQQHEKSELFEAVKGPAPLIDQRASLKAIRDELAKLAKVARPDDWLVLSLSGHGTGVPDPTDARSILPGSFYFVCHDTVAGKPETGLRGQDLSRLLGNINCHKLILLDACHSGDKVPDLVRDLNRDTARFLMFTACKHTEEAGEPNLQEINKAIAANREEFAYLTKLNLQHGLFTLGLLNTLGNPATMRGQARMRPVTADEVRITITATIARMRRNLKQSDKEPQTPVFFPDDPNELGRLAIFCVPVKPKP